MKYLIARLLVWRILYLKVMNNLDEFVHKEYIEKELRFSHVYRSIDKHMHNTDAVIANATCNPDVKENYTIWVLWLQGMNNAPKLIQKCFEALCINKPEGFDVIVLDNSNLKEYISLPEYVWEKYNQGVISATHLSDIIRMELLYVYGGLWIDATVYCMDKIPDFMISGDLFMFKIGAVVTNPVLKMSSWWIYARKGNKLIQNTRNILYRYWKEEAVLIDYFLVHIIMSKFIDTDSECRRIFNNIPYFNSGNAHILGGKLSVKYSEDEWEIIKYTSPVQKLTYKSKYIRGDLYNFYSAIIDGDFA